MATSIADALPIAVALMLIIEGAMPLMAPDTWRKTLQRVMEFSNGQIRFIGLAAMLAGMLMLVVLL